MSARLLLACCCLLIVLAATAATASSLATSDDDSTGSADAHTDSDSGGAAMTMGSGGAAACVPVHFAVPLFGGGPSGPNGTLSIATYHSASDTAHSVLGFGVLCMVFAWAGFVLEVWRLRTASRISGGCQMAMGGYLFAWLMFLMHPSFDWEEVRALWSYSGSDMLQLQHAAIAAALCAGGIIEVLQAQYLLAPMTAMPLIEAVNIAASEPPGASSSTVAVDAPALRREMAGGTYWHELWSINLMLTGLIFMLHPQHSYSATIKHLILGVCLVLGGPLLIRAKAVAWTAEMQALAAGRGRPSFHIDWSMVAAGGCFALAACILLAFSESALLGPHMGTTSECQPSLSIVVLTWGAAMASSIAAVVAGAKQWRANERKQRLAQPAAGVQQVSDSGCLHALRQRIQRRRGFGLLWGGDAEEQQDMVELELSASPAATAHHLPRHLQSHAAADAEQLAEWNAAVESGHGHNEKSTAANGASSATLANRELLSAYAPAATATVVMQRPPAHHAATAVELDFDDDDEEQRRDRQRDRRRQESYTGEDDDASAV